METKQVIVVRKFPKGLRRGKEIAQGAHGALAFLGSQLRNRKPTPDGLYTISLTPAQMAWFQSSYKKVTVQVNSDEELLEIHRRAREAGLESHLITDSGLTEFDGVPTNTVVCIGPDESAKIDAITGGLALY